jgi:hypothetical protein
MALEWTQPLTEMSTRNHSEGKARHPSKADNITTIYEPIVEKMWQPRRLTDLWASTDSYRDKSTFYIYHSYCQGLRGVQEYSFHFDSGK